MGYWICPVGEVLGPTLKNMGMSQAEFARQTTLSTKHVNQIIKGAAPVSPAVALAIAEVTGIPAEVWLILSAIQQLNEIRIVRGDG